jgi:hypothetical protein
MNERQGTPMNRLKRCDMSPTGRQKNSLRSGTRLIVFTAMALSAFRLATAPCSGQDKGRSAATRHIPIMTWPGPEASLLSPETFRLEAEAGFSVNMSFFGERKVNLKALDLALGAGLRLMVQDDRVAKLVEDLSLPLDVLARVVADYKGHPALYGYFVTDEPNAVKFARLGAIVRRLKELDPAHPAYINLFPTYASEQQLGTPTYEEHVARYLETVHPPFVSYDHYPVTKSGLRRDYYRNLETIRRLAMDHGLDFWAFTLVTPHYDYPPPTIGHIRLQLWSDIAYGAKALQYFTYGTPGGSGGEFGTGLIDREGRPGPAYPLAREVNAEIRRVQDLILRWKSVAVFHSAPLPEGAFPLRGDGSIVSVSGAPLVIGVFSDGPARYVILVNRDYERARTAVIGFASDTQKAGEIAKNDHPPARFAWPAGQAERVCVLDFEPGDARIFRLK